ncbi:MAG: tRNA(Met) cytidine acetyltransferase [Gammaproteobacteria bacterium]|nr:tRNA(Met) cytidine acetyltransferase [Gammaproteobacteria bacterium]
MSAIDINSWMTQLLACLGRNRQRQLFSLQGPRDWCDARLEALLQLEPGLQVLSNRRLGAEPIPFNKADTCLGGEARLVALDLFEGFNPDVLCIAAGLVQAGGVLLLLSPKPGDWSMAQDRYACWQDQSRSRRARFAEYFFTELEADSEVGLQVTPESLPAVASSLAMLSATPILHGQTAEQGLCLQRIERCLARKQDAVVLIRADRGRGKSSCLGLLVERLQADYRIVVCANSRQSAAALLRLAPHAVFVAPDRLLQERPVLDLVVIDEAAMIPLSLLRQIQRHYPRLVMATTSGGYEGTGQGFMLRFVAALDSANLLQLELRDPVRWCRGDRLESWLDRVLMLDSETLSDGSVAPDVDACELQLVEDPGNPDYFPLLQQVYRLLNAAHYRTRPSDLRMLMENPDLRLIVARAGEQVVGAILLNQEGGLDDDLCEQVFLGYRRPQGHLLAQMLTAHAGLRRFACYRGLRVQRIAVNQAWRRRGLGTRLLEAALEHARVGGLDYLGASFAFDMETASFWQQTQFALAHISYAQGKSSGDHSIAVLRSLTPQVGANLARLQCRIRQQLPAWMTQFLQGMEAEQVVALLRFAGYEAALSDLEQDEIEAFARGNKGFESCFVSVQKFIMRCVAQSVEQSPRYFDSLLIEKAIQNRDWNRLEREPSAKGRKQLQNCLRRLVEAELNRNISPLYVTRRR